MPKYAKELHSFFGNASHYQKIILNLHVARSAQQLIGLMNYEKKKDQSNVTEKAVKMKIGLYNVKWVFALITEHLIQLGTTL